MSDPLAAHLTKWRLTPDGEPFETNSSWLAFVRAGGAPALLKVYKPGADELSGAAVLRHWGNRAAQVFEADDGAVLMERAMPGTPLTEFVSDDDRATNIWCDTVQALHVKPAPEGWPDLLRCGRKLNNPWPQQDGLTRDVFERGKAEYFGLCATQAPERFLLHGDLHHANMLKDDKRGWLVVDPKGYAGEIAFETAAFLHNPTRKYWQASVLERRIAILARRLALDAERVLRWSFAYGVLSAIWSIEDGHDPVRGIESAKAALEVLGRAGKS